MSDFGVYEDEMLNNRFSDQDVDRLLSGEMPEDEDLAALAPILEALHGGDHRSLSEERIARFAAQAAEIATSTRPAPAGTAAPERTTTRSRRFVLALRQKVATGLGAALLLSGMTGVAFASNHSAPGDPLYGLDRALEAVGIGDGGAAERIAEAQTLFNQGQVAEAVAHSAQAVEAVGLGDGAEIQFSPEAANASEALEDAAEEVRNGNDDGESQPMRDAVAFMLEEMATMMEDPNLDGEAFGIQVAELARGIRGDLGDDAAANAEDGLNTADEAVENADNDAAEEAVDNENADNGDNENADNAEQGEDAGPPDSVPPEGTSVRP